jgi:hypothetical protein
MNQTMKSRRKKEVNINTNFSMFNKGRSGQDRGILIDKEEPVGVIASDGTIDFHICAQYGINPGQANLFPILSQEAKVYEKYMFEELEFFTVPLVSEYAQGGQQGETALAINYNPALPAPASQTATLSLKPYNANLPCLPLRIKSTRSDLTQTTAMYVRTGMLPGNTDIKTYDVGNLYVTCEGLSPTDFNICRLFVRYKCRLYNRVVLTNQGAPTNNACSFLTNVSGAVLDSSGTYKTIDFGGISSSNFQRCNGLGVINNAGDLTIPTGNYNIDLNCYINRTSSVNGITNYGCTLYLNGNAQYPNATAGPGFNAQYVQCTANYCLALKETDIIRVRMFAIYNSGPNDAAYGGTIRITSV